MAWLALLFVIIPAVELGLLIEIGGMIGTLNTFVLIVITGVIGAALAKRQGLSVLNKLRTELSTGGWPGTTIADGAIVVFAGALLLTPGVLTDAVGFLCLIPATRSVIRKQLEKRFAQRIVVQTVSQPFGAPSRTPPPGGPIIDITDGTDGSS